MFVFVSVFISPFFIRCVTCVFAGKMRSGEKVDLSVKDQEPMTNFIKRHQETSKHW